MINSLDFERKLRGRMTRKDVRLGDDCLEKVEISGKREPKLQRKRGGFVRYKMDMTWTIVRKTLKAVDCLCVTLPEDT